MAAPTSQTSDATLKKKTIKSLATQESKSSSGKGDTIKRKKKISVKKTAK
jgi:hypothetical protein